MTFLIIFGLIFVAIFLILVVLVQRGRGGGLAGALGGMGGQSAFGTKAGDTFTKITIWTAAVWILLCVAGVKYLSSNTDDTPQSGASSASSTDPAQSTRPPKETVTPEAPAPSGGAPKTASSETKPVAPPSPAPPATPAAGK